MCTDSTSELLFHTKNFVPTPVGHCCHKSILSGVTDFLRKYQWHFVNFSGSSSQCRFPFRSGKFPPKNLVPDSILAKCEDVLKDVNALLRRCKNCFPTDNLTSTQRSELQRLSTDSSIIVTPVDKGSGWAIIPNAFYEAESYRQLCDEQYYIPLERDIDIHTRTRLCVLLDSLYSRHFLTRREHQALQPHIPERLRKFYLLPKVHKSEWSFPYMPPGRPIVSDIGSVTRTCATLLEFFLAPLARAGSSFVRDSLNVIARIRNVNVSDDSFFVTFDIASLYTNIPTEAGILAVSKAFLKFPDPKRPDLTLLTMLRIVLTNNTFSFRDEHFVQVQGTAMGCVFGPSYANIFLNEWEDAIYEYSIKPICWLRYIDDIFFVWNSDEMALLSFKAFIDSIYPSIKVDITYSIREIRFLDLLLYKSNGSIMYKVGFKSTDTHFILSPLSYHPRSVFRSIIFGQLYRWASRCSTYADFLEIKRAVSPVWLRQGYTRTAIRNAIRRLFRLTGQSPVQWNTGFFPCPCGVCLFSSPTFSVSNTVNDNLFLIVHRLSCESRNVVYFIKCKNCNTGYVGQTSRPLRKRISEHLYHIRSCMSTPVAQHFNGNCSLSDFHFTGLEHCPIESKRLLKENAWIKRLQTLSPSGLNHELNQMNRVHLVVPFSECSQKVIQLCKRKIDASVCPSFTMHRNLESIVSFNR